MTIEINNVSNLPAEHDKHGFYAIYEPKEVIGKGACSEVRRCIKKGTNEQYAVKIVDVSGEKNDPMLAEQTRQETLREIEILHMCKGHPNIIQLIDSFHTATFLFLIFPLCRRGELFDYLTEVVSISEKRTRMIMRQLLNAIVYVHDRNIVHRDLKPENILLDERLNVNLSDFGFAVIVEPDELLVDLFGTPAYLAPEVFAVSMFENTQGYGKEVDMWACGVIMYTLLVGAPPFWHRKQMNMIRMIMQARYSFNSPEWEDISQDAKDLISKLLILEPSQRLTAREALNHPFCKTEAIISIKFHPRTRFKAAIICIRFIYRLRFLYNNPAGASIDSVSVNPYGVKNLRKIIDASAFRIYGHWVKKGDNQNRAALFENTMKTNLTGDFLC